MTYLSFLQLSLLHGSQHCGHWYVSNAAMMLAAVSANISSAFSDGTRWYGVLVRRTGTFFMLHVQM